MQDFETLINIAKRKSAYDQTNPWYNGSKTYLSEIKSEIDEVIEEIPKDRLCFLEDELADVLWDYLNIIMSLEKETGVELKSVLSRACQKYETRIAGIENGESWAQIKAKQKLALTAEHRSFKKTS